MAEFRASFPRHLRFRGALRFFGDAWQLPTSIFCVVEAGDGPGTYTRGRCREEGGVVCRYRGLWLPALRDLFERCRTTLPARVCALAQGSSSFQFLPGQSRLAKWACVGRESPTDVGDTRILVFQVESKVARTFASGRLTSQIFFRRQTDSKSGSGRYFGSGRCSWCFRWRPRCTTVGRG